MCQYLERFYSYKKISNISLKVHLYLLNMPKTIEIGNDDDDDDDTFIKVSNCNSGI